MQGKKAAILVYDYFEEAELVAPKEALEAAGIPAVVVSPVEGPLTAIRHTEKGSQYAVDINLDTAEAADYDALVIPGGVINSDKLRMETKARQWIRDFMAAGKPVAVICHGPWLLVSAGVVKGRQLTSYYTLQDDIRNAGGEWRDNEVVVDGALITSRNPDDLPAFNEALLQMIGHAQANK